MQRNVTYEDPELGPVTADFDILAYFTIVVELTPLKQFRRVSTLCRLLRRQVLLGAAQGREEKRRPIRKIAAPITPYTKATCCVCSIATPPMKAPRGIADHDTTEITPCTLPSNDPVRSPARGCCCLLRQDHEPPDQRPEHQGAPVPPRRRGATIATPPSIRLPNATLLNGRRLRSGRARGQRDHPTLPAA